ncbi:hypothetical protein BY454_10644 [Marinobacter persicus]|jgi:hypothetical protein|uniref:Uncharacterized protein n=1 Tax=Marinobacter persicus TaxID=930118 RepID=A0A2S6G7S7_9GAMM|nr:MAG: hypothetical protein AWU57_1182 [Marinobacter sp. T13-3]PPK52119.1 hypothetical protein BY455_10744 [Marinobacter persicus]PPK55193.1 hypothetical protein B0H24_1007103 [Marinobacter persicus]PPK58879.1 hypothetical protein BY454_10644 [Marinobacter persicus]
MSAFVSMAAEAWSDSLGILADYSCEFAMAW